MQPEDSWDIEEKKEEPAKLEYVTGTCPFHPKVELEIGRVVNHFLYRCQEAQKHMGGGKFYKFCNCGNVFVDHGKYEAHCLSCKFVLKKLDAPDVKDPSKAEWESSIISKSVVEEDMKDIVPKPKFNQFHIGVHDCFHDDYDTKKKMPSLKKRYFDQNN